MRAIFIFLISLSLWGTDCLGLFRQLVGSEKIAAKYKFNYSQFEFKKNKFVRELEGEGNLSSYQVNSSEEFVALMEAYHELFDPNFRHLTNLLQTKPGLRERWMLEKLNLSLRKPRMSMHRFERLFEDVYSLSLIRDESLFKRTIEGLQDSVSIKAVIRQRMEYAFLKNNMEQALHSLGFLKEPNILEKFMSWKTTTIYHNVVQTAASIAVDFATTVIMGKPILFPRLSRMKYKKIPQHVFDLIERSGFDAAYPVLKELYGKHAQFDIFFNLGQKAYLALMLPTIGAFLHENFPIFQFMYQWVFVHPDVQTEIIDVVGLREELYMIWLNQYIIENAAAPTQEESDQEYDRLENLTPEELQAEYELKTKDS